MLKIEKLNKSYGKTLAVDNLNIKIEPGEVFGFIGPNGAGKSTTIRCVMNFIRKNSGNIYLHDKKIHYGDYLYKEDIGYLPGECDFYNDFTVKEMLDYSESFYKKDCHGKIADLVALFQVDLKKKVGELSLGNKKKVGIIVALMHSPKLLILDEPTSGLDPIMQNVLFDLLLEEKKKKTTIFFSTHNLNEVKKICDNVGIIKEGKLIKVENIKDLSNKNFSIVSITSDEVDKLSLGEEIIIKEKTPTSISFIYKGDINQLINQASKIKVKNIFIEEPNIEEIFLHYYR